MNPRLLAFFVCLQVWNPLPLRAAEQTKPVQVFILAGQSNMEGQAVVDLDGKDYNNGKGTLKALFDDPAKAKLVRHLKNDQGGWTVRENVWVRYQREKGLLLAGPLTMGFSVYGVNDFFPFNRAELKETEPEVYELMVSIWEKTPAKP